MVKPSGGNYSSPFNQFKTALKLSSKSGFFGWSQYQSEVGEKWFWYTTPGKDPAVKVVEIRWVYEVEGKDMYAGEWIDYNYDAGPTWDTYYDLKDAL